MNSREMNTTEHLWDRVIHATADALACGALCPISTDIAYVADSGVEFPVRYFPQLVRKARDTTSARHIQSPFLHPEPALHVADISKTHVCLLNKFPVFEHHLLIVTREFEDQNEPLNRNDFSALWCCMAEYEGLGFYNGGTTGGASQRHKHLQLVALPLAPRGPQIPIEPLLGLDTLAGDIDCSPQLPFLHRLARLPANCLDSVAAAADLTRSLYRKMLSDLGRNPDASPMGAYNLLVTRRWLLLVPRSQEKFESMSLNSLAFAGHFLVRNDAEMALLRQQGPLSVLQHVASHT